MISEITINHRRLKIVLSSAIRYILLSSHLSRHSSLRGSWLSVRKWNALLKACRPLQWVKNVLVFAAPLFAFSFSPEILTSLVLTFAIFCGLSSGTYLLNDLLDVKSDRLHPVKRKRPLASGALTPQLARLAALVLIAASLAASYFVSPLLTLTAGAYVAIQILTTSS